MPIKYQPSGNLIIGGTVFKTEAPIVNFTEGPKWDAKSQRCFQTETEPGALSRCTFTPEGNHYPYGKNKAWKGGQPITIRSQPRNPLRRIPGTNNGRDARYEHAKGVIKQFLIHHDGCATADMCFTVLQNERGLSCHFLVDNDGTIFQTLDLAWQGFHGSQLNDQSIGVELCNRGEVDTDPAYYSKKGLKREVEPCKINEHTIKSFAFTDDQWKSMILLSRALLKYLPNLTTDYPQTSPGVQAWGTMPFGKVFNSPGFLGHYHLTSNKWDPGPWNFKEFCSKLRGTFCYPVFPKDADRKKPDEVPEVPQDLVELNTANEELYKQNEVSADGGFFPVGPWGDARLWHGGVHLTGKVGHRVFSPFPGRIVAARMGASSSIGSNNFVLIRHGMALGDRKLEFFSLYMHLADEDTQKPLEWMTKDGWKKKASKPGQVTLLDEAIEGGTVIGRIGSAGPSDLARAQVHIEFMSQSDLFENYDRSPWQVVDGTGSGRFCDVPDINNMIDTNKDGLLSRAELSTFYQSGGGVGVRYLVTRHVTEWNADPSWREELLREASDFPGMSAAEIEAMVAEQITPGLWWDETLAKHCKLPPDGIVYHYNPVSFVGWVNKELVDWANKAPKHTVDPNAAGKVPKGVTDDGDAEGDEHMRSADETVVDPCDENLTLKELVLGFDAPECGPQ
ncbi:MAG: N-acetylmuramoyl-L-alanine amidase [Kofleriaceae bacterium]